MKRPPRFVHWHHQISYSFFSIIVKLKRGISSSANPQSQLDQIHLREVRRRTTIHSLPFAIQTLPDVTNPQVLAESTHSPNFIITDTQLISRDPDDWPRRSERDMLECALHEGVPLLWCQVFQLVTNTCQ